MFFYITFKNLYSAGYTGIRKKILAQVKAFEKELGVSYYTLWCNQNAYLMHGEKVIEKALAITRKEYSKVLVDWIKKYQVDKTYVRYPISDNFFLDFLKYQSKNGIKTVMEIPTYPYDGELICGRVKAEDTYYREKISNYIEVVSTYSYDKKIWGRRCITLTNGVDLDKISFKKKEKNQERITMVAVGSMEKWHGFERIIEGMGRYYNTSNKQKIYFRLVGDGGELNRYQKDIHAYEVQDYVEICGRKVGEELEECFLDADIAIGSLGFYKTGIQVGSPIKGAEYCARGLPMVLGYTDMRFTKDIPFVLNVPNDNSPVNIEQIIDFYNTVSAQPDYQERIRNYAVQNLSWEKIMEPVVKYLKEGSNE